MKKYLAMLGLMFATVVWGGGFVASDIALTHLTPFQILCMRFGIATVLMGLMSMKNLKGITKKEWKSGLLLGVALFISFTFQVIGLKYTTASKNAFLTGTYVVMVPFIAYVILKKKIGWKGILGAVMALMGVGILSLNGDFTMGLGDALTLVCAVGFAFQIFMTGVFVQECRADILNFLQMLTTFILSMICLLVSGELQFELTQSGVLSVIYLGVISTTLCYFLQTTCQKYVDESRAAIILSMESVFGTLLSIMILHEQITGRMILGCVIIFAAVLIANIGSPEEKKA